MEALVQSCTCVGRSVADLFFRAYYRESLIQHRVWENTCLHYLGGLLIQMFPIWTKTVYSEASENIIATGGQPLHFRSLLLLFVMPREDWRLA